jgi:hypothetical protein
VRVLRLFLELLEKLGVLFGERLLGLCQRR